MRRRVAAALLGTLLLAGCGSSSPGEELRSKVGAVTDAANAGSADSLTAAVDDLLATAKDQYDGGKLPLDRYTAIKRYALRVKADAALLQGAPTPSAVPVPVATPTSAPPTEKGKDEKGKGKKDSGSPSPSVTDVVPTAVSPSAVTPTAVPSVSPTA